MRRVNRRGGYAAVKPISAPAVAIDDTPPRADAKLTESSESPVKQQTNK